MAIIESQGRAEFSAVMANTVQKGFKIGAPCTSAYVRYGVLFVLWRNPPVFPILGTPLYRCHLFSVAVARGGRVYGLEHLGETVDWAPTVS